MTVSSSPRISIVGLGYVGLPLAIALARQFDVVGYDVKSSRIEELQQANDRTGEISPHELRSTKLKLTADGSEIAGCDLVIVTVPTPVDEENQPDLGILLSACATIGKHLRQGTIVAFESTVYPGVTEDICGPALERASGLRCGRDFFLGYSPERINPGDREHTVDRITKVISGQTVGVIDTLKTVYGTITNGNLFVAKSIKTAEAAKVIENAQRDINIAFINEVTMIFQKMGLSAHDVLDAAGTKWNFLRFTPGLVGGHCIGVDPFYLAHRAMTIGHDPQVILAGRRINDGMGFFIARRIDALIPRRSRILVLGLTFKENVPDLRNSKVVDIIAGLRKAGHEVMVHDPLADPAEAFEHYEIRLTPDLANLSAFDAIVGAVSHNVYGQFRPDDFARLVKPGGLVADVKAIWRRLSLPQGVKRWEL